jgi:hypothetical protein
MYDLPQTLSLSEHADDLVFLQGALEVARDEGVLPQALQDAAARVEGMVEEFDALDLKIRRAQRALRINAAHESYANLKQDLTIRALWVKTLAAASQDKKAEVYKLLFEGGLTPLIRPRPEGQIEATRDVVRTLEARAAYDGPLRQEFAPILTTQADRAASLLARRRALEDALVALYDEARALKARANALRQHLGAQLLAHAIEQSIDSPKDWARSFFGRGQ